MILTALLGRDATLSTHLWEREQETEPFPWQPRGWVRCQVSAQLPLPVAIRIYLINP